MITPSPSFPRKRGSKINSEHVASLLQDGSIHEPEDELVQTAAELSDLGIVSAEISTYVKCANERDRDFKYHRNRGCRGRIFIESGLDEDGDDYRCPECDRAVRPLRLKKQLFKILRTTVVPKGVKSYVYDLLAPCEGFKEECGFVCRIEAGSKLGWVCVVDYCNDNQYLNRERASMNPTCYVYVDEQCCDDRFLTDDWIIRVSLTDILCGKQNLAEIAMRTAEAGSAKGVEKVSPSVYSIGPRPIYESVEPTKAGRSFELEIHPDRVDLAGETILPRKATAQMDIFQVLLTRFCEDLRNGLTPEQYRPMTVEEITDALDDGSDADAPDNQTTRRAVNRLQETLETAVKKNTGLPIDRTDIVQTVNLSDETTTDHGYRLNPFTIILRPLKTAKK